MPTTGPRKKRISSEKGNRRAQLAFPPLELRTHYRVGRGGAWGNYDFWIGIIGNIAVAYLVILFNKLGSYLAKKIRSTLNSSKAENVDTESARYDLLLSFDNGSLAVLRVMQEAKFRSQEPIVESDISSALTIVVNRIRTRGGKDKKPVIVVGELFNRSDGIQLSVHKVESLEAAPALQQQVYEAKRGKVTRIRL